jgi:hypothetical protein
VTRSLLGYRKKVGEIVKPALLYNILGKVSGTNGSTMEV